MIKRKERHWEFNGRRIESVKDAVAIALVFVGSFLIVGPICVLMMMILDWLEYLDVANEYRLGVPALVVMVLILLASIGAWWFLILLVLGVPWTTECG